MDNCREAGSRSVSDNAPSRLEFRGSPLAAEGISLCTSAAGGSPKSLDWNAGSVIFGKNGEVQALQFKDAFNTPSNWAARNQDGNRSNSEMAQTINDGLRAGIKNYSDAKSLR